MEITGPEFGNMPKRYKMNKSNEFTPMSIFSDTNQGKVAVEGKVNYKVDMLPHIENLDKQSYHSIGNKRQIKRFHNDHGEHMMPMPGMDLASSRTKTKSTKPVPVKQPEEKRTRGDRGEIETKMFKLFEGQPNWTLKQLVNATDQPAQFIKEILHEMCVYNMRGLKIGTYELKPEYKIADEENTSG